MPQATEMFTVFILLVDRMLGKEAQVLLATLS